VGAPLPPRSSPLQTLPAVDVSRGSEGALPGGTVTVRFAAGVMGLAALLAAGPRVVVEVWHKERWVASSWVRGQGGCCRHHIGVGAVHILEAYLQMGSGHGLRCVYDE
jgi:hypothetical protein